MGNPIIPQFKRLNGNLIKYSEKIQFRIFTRIKISNRINGRIKWKEIKIYLRPSKNFLVSICLVRKIWNFSIFTRFSQIIMGLLGENVNVFIATSVPHQANIIPNLVDVGLNFPFILSTSNLLSKRSFFRDWILILVFLIYGENLFKKIHG